MWSKLKSLFAHSKTILVARVYAIGGSAVAIHDVAAPYVSTTDITPISQKLPSWVWPLLVIGTGVTFEWLRRVTVQPLADNQTVSSLTTKAGLQA
jgi:hypothetical protein